MDVDVNPRTDVPTDAYALAEHLATVYGLAAYVMDPGPGNVHVSLDDGSGTVFLSDSDGSHPDPEYLRGLSVGRMFYDGREEYELWHGPHPTPLSYGVDKLIAFAVIFGGRW